METIIHFFNSLLTWILDFLRPISVWALGKYPFAESVNLMSWQLFAFIVVLLLFVIIWLVCRRKAIVIDRMLNSGKYWIVILGIVVLLILIIIFSTHIHHLIRENAPEDIIQTSEKHYNSAYDVLGFFFGTQKHITEIQNEPLHLILMVVLRVVIFNGMFIAALVGLFSQRRMKIRKGEIRYSRFTLCGARYAVVIGANEVAASVIRNLLRQPKWSFRNVFSRQRYDYDELNRCCENDNDYVILQTNGEAEKVRKVLESHLTEYEMKHVVIYNGLRDSLDEIRALYLEYATEIYVLGENTHWDKGESYHDTINMRCVKLIADVLNEKRIGNKGRKKCSVLFEYQTTSSIFQFSKVSEDILKVLDFIPFNRYESWAKNVFVKHRAYELVDRDDDSARKKDEIEYVPLDGDGIGKDDNKHVHLVVVGMSKMGVAMGLQAISQAHFPNFEKRPDQRTRVTFIDAHADSEMRFFKGRFASLFELMRQRYVDANDPDQTKSEYAWKDPMAEADSKWKHLTDDQTNFLDVEIEFVKGSLESDGVRDFLREICKDKTAKLTIAICLTQAHQAIAASLYMPIEVYKCEQLLQILVYQREAYDIVYNLDKLHIDSDRYSMLRPFGMLYGEYMTNIAYYLKASLVNWAYDVIVYNKEWPEDAIHSKEISDSWNRLNVANQYANFGFVDTCYQKLRSVCKNSLLGGVHDDIYFKEDVQTLLTNAIESEKELLAHCEHNRWNVERLLMGFSPCTEDDLKTFMELAENGASDNELMNFKKQLKIRKERMHLNICSNKRLLQIDPEAYSYDATLNAAIPRILMLVDGYGVCTYRDASHDEESSKN